MVTAFLILCPAIGLLAPAAWLTRKVEARKLAIRKDLPDTLDLLAISVEAGMGFEGAVDIVCQHFDSPTEMRNKRRQWAREKAAKLPVKILFPLVGFIFPSILIVIIGPGASGIMKSVS